MVDVLKLNLLQNDAERIKARVTNPRQPLRLSKTRTSRAPGLRNLYTIPGADKNFGLMRLRAQTDILGYSGQPTEVGIRGVLETSRIKDISHPGSVIPFELAAGFRIRLRKPDALTKNE